MKFEYDEGELNILNKDGDIIMNYCETLGGRVVTLWNGYVLEKIPELADSYKLVKKSLENKQNSKD